MSEHPLPAVPHEDQDEPQLEVRFETNGQTECERISILKGSGDTYALFDDTSEIDLMYSACSDEEHHGLSAFLHTTEPSDDLLSQTSPAVMHAGQTCNSAGDSQRSQQGCFESGLSHARDRLKDLSWPVINDAAFPPLFRHASCDAVRDYVPNTTSDQRYTYCSSDADYDLRYDALTESDDEPSRETLVRFADVHTVLCTPHPPTPPPHLTLSSTSSLPSVPLRLKPYGPRIPPWGSTEHLDHERRLRNEIRVLEDTLDEQFDKRARLRKEEEAKNGKRRTEGEELRELVLGIYPEIEAARTERGCCLCVVM
ncbi:hypothetical protein PMIN07_008970 [Paraphaeosphaeria minitans]